jgi:hypothetical protein
MRAAPIIVCLWPGLAGLWLRGRTSGLLTALAFAALLNSALAASFFRLELPGSVLGRVVWIAVVALWVVGFWRNLRQLPQLLASPPPPKPALDLFPQAQTEYLKGHWFEAESLLAKQLRTMPQDADSHLMLATLYRHTGRLSDARKQLHRLQRCETSTKWQFEIQQEKQLLDEREAEQRDAPAQQPGQEQRTNQQEPAKSTDFSPAAPVAESSRAA